MEHKKQQDSYQPLIAIVAGSAMAAFALTYSGLPFMRAFMGVFLLIFAMLKMFDLKGFENGFAMYDLITRRVPAYGFIYPFFELALALCYLSGLYLYEAYIGTLVLMGFTTIGVLNGLRSGMDLHCACMGTILKVPLSTVSLVENIGMFAMAAWMLVSMT